MTQKDRNPMIQNKELDLSTLVIGAFILIVLALSSCTSMKKDCRGNWHRYNKQSGIYI